MRPGAAYRSIFCFPFDLYRGLISFAAFSDVSRQNFRYLHRVSNLPILTKDPLGHSTLSILLGVENYTAWLPRIKSAIESLDADHLILTIAISPEDKKLQKKAMDLLVSKIGDDPLLVINGIDTLKGILDQFSGQYAEKGWGSKQLTWEPLRHLRYEDCATTIDYVTRFRLAVHRLRNLGQELDNDRWEHPFCQKRLRNHLCSQLPTSIECRQTSVFFSPHILHFQKRFCLSDLL